MSLGDAEQAHFGTVVVSDGVTVRNVGAVGCRKVPRLGLSEAAATEHVGR